MFDLDRFVKAQGPVIDTVLRELRAGRKETHWMWFVFPQLHGLGRSPMAQHYGIDSLDEARSYLGHAVLGPRLKECVEAVLGVTGKTLHEILETFVEQFGRRESLVTNLSIKMCTYLKKDIDVASGCDRSSVIEG